MSVPFKFSFNKKIDTNIPLPSSKANLPIGIPPLLVTQTQSNSNSQTLIQTEITSFSTSENLEVLRQVQEDADAVAKFGGNAKINLGMDKQKLKDIDLAREKALLQRMEKEKEVANKRSKGKDSEGVDAAKGLDLDGPEGLNVQENEKANKIQQYQQGTETFGLQQLNQVTSSKDRVQQQSNGNGNAAMNSDAAAVTGNQTTVQNPQSNLNGQTTVAAVVQPKSALAKKKFDLFRQNKKVTPLPGTQMWTLSRVNNNQQTSLSQQQQTVTQIQNDPDADPYQFEDLSIENFGKAYLNALGYDEKLHYVALAKSKAVAKGIGLGAHQDVELPTDQFLKEKRKKLLEEEERQRGGIISSTPDASSSSSGRVDGGPNQQPTNNISANSLQRERSRSPRRNNSTVNHNDHESDSENLRHTWFRIGLIVKICDESNEYFPKKAVITGITYKESTSNKSGKIRAFADIRITGKNIVTESDKRKAPRQQGIAEKHLETTVGKVGAKVKKVGKINDFEILDSEDGNNSNHGIGEEFEIVSFDDEGNAKIRNIQTGKKQTVTLDEICAFES